MAYSRVYIKQDQYGIITFPQLNIVQRLLSIINLEEGTDVKILQHLNHYCKKT